MTRMTCASCKRLLTKPFAEDVLVQTGSNDIPAAHGKVEVLRFAVVKPVPFRMARDCQYTKTDLGKADKGCTGCSWKQTD